MSRAVLILAVPLLFACTKKDEAPAADTSTPVAAAAPETPNVAGTWAFKVMPTDRDTVLTTYTLVATNDQNGWTLTFPGREPLEVRVLSVSNDSIVTETGPFPSAVQKGQTVNLVHTNMRVDGNTMSGAGIVHYARKTADSVVTLRQEGTRQ